MADAIKRSSSDLEPTEAMIVSLEARRDKALARIAQYRSDLGAQLRASSDRLIESKVLELEHVTAKKQKSAA